MESSPCRATILDHLELGVMFGLDDVDAIAAELRRRGVRYHVSAGGIYTNAADVFATFGTTKLTPSGQSDRQ